MLDKTIEFVHNTSRNLKFTSGFCLERQRKGFTMTKFVFKLNRFATAARKELRYYISDNHILIFLLRLKDDGLVESKHIKCDCITVNVDIFRKIIFAYQEFWKGWISIQNKYESAERHILFLQDKNRRGEFTEAFSKLHEAKKMLNSRHEKADGSRWNPVIEKINSAMNSAEEVAAEVLRGKFWATALNNGITKSEAYKMTRSILNLPSSREQRQGFIQAIREANSQRATAI